MFVIRQPTFTELNDYLLRLTDAPFTYAEVEGTRGPAPDGYTWALSRVRLGRGHETFQRAKRSLQAWEMFPEAFVRLVWPVPWEVGRVVATLFHAPGFWTLNPCRIVYTVDDTVDGEQVRSNGRAGSQGESASGLAARYSDGYSARRPARRPARYPDRRPARQAGRTEVERCGFAYGTVGDHLASGEERFTVEYDHSDRSVWYEVYCFSKARHWLAKAAYPYLRVQQHRFRQLSGLAMQAAVREPCPQTGTAETVKSRLPN